MSRNVLVDGNNILHQAYHVFVKDRTEDPFISHQGYPTGLIYGVLSMLSNWVLEVDRFTAIKFFLDGAPRRRRGMDAEYKLRDSDGFDPASKAPIVLSDGYRADSEVDVLCHVLHLLGVETFHHPDEEADDLIASYVSQHPGDVHVIISSDKDFYQLLSDVVVQYRPGLKGNRFYDADRIERELGVSPDHVRLYKSMVTDSSDNIPGVSRVRKKVIAALCRLGSLQAIAGSDMKPASALEKQKILDHWDRIKLNFDLVGMIRDLDVESMSQKLEPDVDTAKRVLNDDLDIGFLDVNAFVPVRSGFVRAADPVNAVRYESVTMINDDWLKDI